MKVLLLNHAFYPDVVATAQYAADLARELAHRGHEVTVIASRRGYDAPETRFAHREDWEGVNIRRAFCFGFGKGAKWRRVLDFASFLASCAWELARLPRFDAVVAMTSPPLLWFLAAWFAKVRGGRLVMWVMDLNPDEAIAAGWLRKDSRLARALDASQRFSLRRASAVVVLDRFMRERVIRKGADGLKTLVIPPWSHDRRVAYDADGARRFRRTHGLTGKFVVMYSGNHSPCHPLDTVLEAADRLRANERVAFCFIGGGSEFSRIERFAAERGLRNIICLPYQPLDQLSASLSAADLHVVVMGDDMVGIVHPSKIYNILRTSIPFVYVGPDESHVADLLNAAVAGDGCVRIRHGDVAALSEHVAARAQARGPRIRRIPPAAEEFSARMLLPRFAEMLEGAPSAARSYVFAAGGGGAVRGSGAGA